MVKNKPKTRKMRVESNGFSDTYTRSEDESGCSKVEGPYLSLKDTGSGYWIESDNLCVALNACQMADLFEALEWNERIDNKAGHHGLRHMNTQRYYSSHVYAQKKAIKKSKKAKKGAKRV